MTNGSENSTQIKMQNLAPELIELAVYITRFFLTLIGFTLIVVGGNWYIAGGVLLMFMSHKLCYHGHVRHYRSHGNYRK